MRLQAPTWRRSAGFTLLEILVAIAIFAVVGVLALSGYTQLQRQVEYMEQRLDRTREIQRAVQVMVQDLAQIEPRPIREPIGAEHIPAFAAGNSPDYAVEFTRSGWSNTAGLARPTLQRVAYRLDQDGLWRDHWLVLDRTQTQEPIRFKLLGKVRSVKFRFMNTGRNWVDRWPEPTTAGNPGNDRSRPAAVEVTLDLEDWGEIRRVVEVPG